MEPEIHPVAAGQDEASMMRPLVGIGILSSGASFFILTGITDFSLVSGRERPLDTIVTYRVTVRTYTTALTKQRLEKCPSVERHVSSRSW